MSFLDRVRRAWNVFKNKDPTRRWNDGIGYSYRPDRMRYSRGNERSIVTSVYNRISVDTAKNSILHVRLDEQGRYLETVKSGLNSCLTLSANIDQTGRAFVQDAVQSMLDEGCVALVPIDTDDEPKDSKNFKIYTIRTGKIVNWYPSHILVNVYNERTGEREDIEAPKSTTAIVENPFYAVMNEPSSTMSRLARKLGLLDVVDEHASSGRLDMIIQLPYVIKTEARRQQAELRRKDIEQQLSEGKYGIAYTDGTERITQLNRPVENNLMKQIEYLTNLLFSQLGITQAILDGTADDKTMQNYYQRVIEPILSAFTDEMKRKFLTEKARDEDNQSIMFFTDPLKMIAPSQLAELADKLTRNEIVTSNEIRQAIGMPPSKDPNADVLRNKNLSEPAAQMLPPEAVEQDVNAVPAEVQEQPTPEQSHYADLILPESVKQGENQNEV